MPEQIERVVLEATDRTAQATASANANIDTVEKRAKRASEAATAAGDAAGKTIVSVTDRTQKSIDRAVAQAESRLRSLKSPLEQLDSMRSSALSKVAGDPAAIARVTAAYDRLVAIEKTHTAHQEQLNSGAAKFGRNVKEFLEDPVGSAGRAVESLGEGLGGIGILAAGAGAGLLLVSVEAFHLVESSGKAAENLQNMSDRLGLSIEDTQLMADTARIAGVDIEAFTGLSRKLSETLASGNATTDAAVTKFTSLGGRVVDTNGHFRSSLELIRDLSGVLNKLPDHAAQVKLIADLLGKSAVVLLPQIKNFAYLEEKARSVGPALDEGVVRPLAAADDALDVLGIKWDRLKLRLAEKIVATIEIVQKVGPLFTGGALLDGILDKRKKAGVNGAEEAFQNRLQDQATGFSSTVRAADVGPGDALVDRFRSRVDAASVARALAQAETDRNEVAARIQKGAGESVQRAAIAQFDALTVRVDALKKQAKDIAEIPDKEKEAHKGLAAAQAEEAAGLARLYVQRQSQLEQLGVTKKAIADINATFAVKVQLEERSQALQLSTARTQNQLLQAEGDKQRALLGLEPSTRADVDQRGTLDARRAQVEADFETKALVLRESTLTAETNLELAKLDTVHNAKLIDDTTFAAERGNIEARAQEKLNALRIQSSQATEQAIQGARVRAVADTITQVVTLERAAEEQKRQNAITSLEIERDRRLQILGGVQAVTIAQQILIERTRAAVEADFEARALDLKIETLTTERDLEIRSLDALHTAMLISDQLYEDARAAIAAGAQLKIDQLRLSSQAAVIRAEEAAAIKSADIVRQHNQSVFDSYKSGIRSVLDETLDRGKNFFAAIGASIKNAFENAIKDTVATKLAAVLTEATTGSKVSIAHDAAGTGPIGRLLSAIGLGGSGKPVFGAKLEAPGHLGDVSLIGGAVPVVVVGGSPAQQQGNLQQGGSLGRFGAALAGLAGLAGLSGALGAGSVASGAGSGVAAVSSSIDFGQGAQSLGGTFSGGSAATAGSGTFGGLSTPPFVGGGAGIPGGGGGLGSLGSLAGLKKSLSSFDMNFLGGAFHPGNTAGFGGNLAQLGHSNAALLGGGLLAYDGLRRGGVGGLFETTAGGALIGFKYGGPIGAAIGAGVGAIAGTIRLFVKGKAEKLVDRVKSVYGVDITKQFATNPLMQIIDQQFGGNLDVGVRAPAVRDLIALYAQSTGQHFPIADKPQAVSLGISGGVLQQNAAMIDGSSFAYGGGTARLSGPVDNLITGRTPASNGVPGAVVVQSLQLSINGKSAAKALTGQIVASPDAVGQASLAAADRGVSRRQLAVAQTAPGLLLS